MVRLLAAVMAAGFMISCDKTPSRPPAGTHALVSMNPSSWVFQHSPGMPSTSARSDGGGWQFDFPSSDGVHYLVHPVSGRATSHFRIKGEVQVTGTPHFEYRTKADNICDFPAHARFYMQQRGDDLTASKQFYRWWAQTGIKLQFGPFEQQIPFDLVRWSSVLGVKGDAAPDGFNAATNDLQVVGLTFGGGCFYGHGVYVIGGTATFIVREFEVK